MTQANEPAMPIIYEDRAFEGLTKREYFAALAMQGFLAQATSAGHAANVAVEAADALIEALNKENK